MTNANGVFAVGDAIGIHDDLNALISEADDAAKSICGYLDARKIMSFSRFGREGGRILSKIFKVK